MSEFVRGNPAGYRHAFTGDDGVTVWEPDHPGKLAGPGHWRLTYGGKLKIRSVRSATHDCAGNAQRVDGDYIRIGLGNEKNRSLREAVRLAVAYGQIALEDAPEWAKP